LLASLLILVSLVLLKSLLLLTFLLLLHGVPCIYVSAVFVVAVIHVDPGFSAVAVVPVDPADNRRAEFALKIYVHTECTQKKIHVHTWSALITILCTLSVRFNFFAHTQHALKNKICQPIFIF
jgi:hypothetical protein